MSGFDDPLLMEHARRMFEMILPDARLEAERLYRENNAERWVPSSPVAKASNAYMRISNVQGVYVHKGEAGGWLCDIRLKTVPHGFPNILGTPVAAPVETAEEAIRMGVQILAIMIVQESEIPEKRIEDADLAWFEIDGEFLSIPVDLIGNMKEIKGFSETTAADVRQSLKDIRKTMFGGKTVTKEAFEALSKEDQARFLTWCAIAMAKGIIRDPERMAMPASGTLQ